MQVGRPLMIARLGRSCKVNNLQKDWTSDMRGSYRRTFQSVLLTGAALIVTAGATPAPESVIRWDAKNAYLKCDGAIDGTVAWPSAPRAACVAMLMCANERALSAERHRRLIEQIRRVPGCGEP
ncbi:hypothetical protein [Bradyrhizobium sp. C9]|uniref:hypothetical protein n=1 Tax=Bradyrhizobium sp. C9 TaxID=142585 RepID=UPI000BE7C366|nr:hypothetical protein [Bradyrhizobium sp. C9]PDT76031.1 hypothetical protein CO675_18130 [Bradyrhizobium sp. C9]